MEVRWRDACACTVVVAAGGYPNKYDLCFAVVMSGVDDADALPGVTVYHAGTKTKGDQLVTSGGRVVAVSCIAPELKGAVRGAYAGAARVRFSGAFHRGDIARRCLDAPLKVGVLGSTRGTSLQAVLDALSGGTLRNVELACVLSNKKDSGCWRGAVVLPRPSPARGEDRALSIASSRPARARRRSVLCVGWPYFSKGSARRGAAAD